MQWNVRTYVLNKRFNFFVPLLIPFICESIWEELLFDKQWHFFSFHDASELRCMWSDTGQAKCRHAVTTMSVDYSLSRQVNQTIVSILKSSTRVCVILARFLLAVFFSELLARNGDDLLRSVCLVVQRAYQMNGVNGIGSIWHWFFRRAGLLFSEWT